MNKKLIEVALPLEAHQQGVGAREGDSSRAPFDVAPLVGAATAGGGTSSDFCPDGGRSLFVPEPLSH